MSTVVHDPGGSGGNLLRQCFLLGVHPAHHLRPFQVHAPEMQKETVTDVTKGEWMPMMAT